MTAPTVPIVYSWDGDHMVPLPRFVRLTNRQFVVGETYTLVVQEERSQVSHRHFFASIYEAWNNLPEKYAEQFPTSEHLRKWALCKTGFADERVIVCDTAADAQRVAAIARSLDGYAVIVASGETVKVYTAKSQSVRSMTADEFKKSKQAVLDVISEMIGVDPATLSAEAGQAA